MKFITILCTRSAPHLMRGREKQEAMRDRQRAGYKLCNTHWSPLTTVFEEYEKIANKSIEDSIKSETHGSLEEAMLTVGKSSGMGQRPPIHAV